MLNELGASKICLKLILNEKKNDISYLEVVFDFLILLLEKGS